MPIYLVCWERTDACLVGARDEDALRLILDDVGDPSQARWTVYNGPFWLDVKLPQETEQSLPAVDAAAKVSGGERALQLQFGENEAGGAMREVIARWALPHLQEVIDAVRLEAEHQLDAAAPSTEVTGARPWHSRLARAIATGEADMSAPVQPQRASERAEGGERARREALRAAVDRLAETLVQRRAARTRPALTIVRDVDDDAP